MVTHKTISNKSCLQPLFTTAVKVSALLLFSSMLSGCAGGDSVESPSRVNSTVTSNEKSAEDKVNQLTDVGGSVSHARPRRRPQSNRESERGIKRDFARRSRKKRHEEGEKKILLKDDEEDENGLPKDDEEDENGLPSLERYAIFDDFGHAQMTQKEINK